ncbi:hypothetical protein Tco_1381287, partial [Tanacetum coccineum]
CNPEILLQDHAVVDSGCSSHMTGNKAYLSNYEDFNGGFVAFGSDLKGVDAEDEINTGRFEINAGIEDVNTGSTKFDIGRTSISTSCIILSPKKGHREGKAQMV